jgi:hypothetical protein
MKSAIAILTYRRLPALQEELKGLAQHFCSNYPIAVFEDMGERDGTSRFLSWNRRGGRRDPTSWLPRWS